jgi:hypothetical protein
MISELPFFVTTEAMEWLMRLPTYPDRQPGFVSSPRFGVCRGSQLIEEFVGDHFSFTFAPPHDWLDSRGATAFLIGGRPFWISADTLSKLSGMTLRVVEIDVAVGDSAVSMRKFLIPSSDDPRANKALEPTAGAPCRRCFASIQESPADSMLDPTPAVGSA